MSPLVTAPGPSSALPSLVHCTRGGCLARPPGDQSQLSIGAGWPIAAQYRASPGRAATSHLRSSVSPGRGEARLGTTATLGCDTGGRGTPEINPLNSSCVPAVPKRLAFGHNPIINISYGQSSAKLPVTRLLSHSVTLSLCHSVTLSHGHLFTCSLIYLITWSLGHFVTRSLSHMVTQFNMLTDEHTTSGSPGLLRREKFQTKANCIN